MSAPMLVPAYTSGTMPRSSRARSTPMWANPLRPPPPRTRAMRLLTSECFPRPPAPPAALLQVLVEADEADARTADGDRRPCITADDETRQECRSAHHHQR